MRVAAWSHSVLGRLTVNRLTVNIGKFFFFFLKNISKKNVYWWIGAFCWGEIKYE